VSRLLTREAGNPAALPHSELSALRAQALAGAGGRRLCGAVGLDAPDAHAGGRLTLEQRLDSVWEGLQAGGAPDCPVCQAELGPLGAASASRCGRCGSLLS
jgi:hypothetical protein